jgi:hypothetical protein
MSQEPPTQPFGTQPGYGQPIPQQPPAGYGRATVTPGGYGQYDEVEPEPVRRRRRVWPIVLAVVLLLVAVLGVSGYLLARPYFAEYPATLTLPDTLVGHQRSTNPELRQAADAAVAGLRSEIELENAVADFYQDPVDDTRIVWLIGGTKFIMNPGAEIDSAFRGVGSSGDFTMTSPTDVDPGPLGGVARCSKAGIANTGELQIAVCAWADHGALVIVMFFNRTVDESANLLRQIRAQIQSR